MALRAKSNDTIEKDKTVRRFEAYYIPRVENALMKSAKPVLEAVVNMVGNWHYAAAEIDTEAIKPVYEEIYRRVGGYFAKWQADKLAESFKFGTPDMSHKQEETGTLPSAPPPAIVGGFVVGVDDAWLTAVNDWLFSQGAVNISTINATSRELMERIIRDAVDIAVRDGLSIPNTVKLIEARILDEWKVAAKYRADRIARTEVLSATSYASQVGADATGLLYDKVWDAFLDSRTRPAHVQAHGQRVGKYGKFEVDGVLMERPHDPAGGAANVINCRCTALFIPTRDAQGRLNRG